MSTVSMHIDESLVSAGFARAYKKLTNAALIVDTDAAVATVADNPDVEERKTCG